MNNRKIFKKGDHVVWISKNQKLTISNIAFYGNDVDYYFNEVYGYLNEHSIELDKRYYRKEKIKKILKK